MEYDGVIKEMESVISNAISEAISDLRFNFQSALRLMVERLGVTKDNPEWYRKRDQAFSLVDSIITTVLETTHREGPEDESYPAYDRKKVEVLINQLREVLKD